MRRQDLAYIQRAFANTRPDMRTAPVSDHNEWRRIVTQIGAAFEGSPWAHLHDPDEWLEGTGAAVREPAPREGEPYEADGTWFNLTESEATARGLIQSPYAAGWVTPRNLDASGEVIRDAVARVIMDAVTGEWRDMTPAEGARYPLPEGLEGVPYPDAVVTGARTHYCREPDPSGCFVCSRPPGHAGLHVAMSATRLEGLCPPWIAAARPTGRCDMEHELEDGEVVRCDRRRGHVGEHTATTNDGGDACWDC